MNKNFTKEILFLFFLFLSANIYGQGSISGIVTDSLSNDALVGANVYLRGTALGAAVDIEGEYKITRIPEGQYTVIFSYVGYKQKQIDVTVYNNRTLELFVELVPDIITGTEDIVVSAQALGQAAAINQQLNSNTIVNVISEQKIQELPDANAAEAIGRLPGVSITRSGGEASQAVLRGLSSKFSTITVDGVTMAPTGENDRSVDLSTISQGSLAGIELFKAITSDKDGDAIAGSINLVTKKAPYERQIRLDTRGAYNGLDKSADQYNFIGRYGERFFNGVLGVQIIGNIEKTIRSNEEPDASWDQSLNDGKDYQISGFEVTYTDEDRKRAGGSILLDFNTPDSGTVKFNTVYNETSREYFISQRSYNGITGNGVGYEYRNRKTDLSVFSSALSGQNYLLGFDVDWNLSFSQSERKDPLNYMLHYNEDSIIKDGEIVAGMENVPAQYNKGPFEALVPYAINNFSLAYIGDSEDRTSRNYENNKAAQLDLSRKYNFSNALSGDLKIGGKYRVKSRYRSPFKASAKYYLFSHSDYDFIQNEDGTISPKQYPTEFSDLKLDAGKVLFTNFLNANPETRDIYGKYSLYPLINRDALNLWRQLELKSVTSLGKPLYQRDNFEDANYYDVSEATLSGYLMNTLNFGRELTLITGVRIEQDDNDYGSKFSPRGLSGFPYPLGELKDTTSSFTQTEVLPNLQVIFRPLSFMNIRMAAYKALARPDFNRRLLKFVLENSSGASLTVGQPNLKNAVAWNFELQTQFYGNDIGLFSISAFYKDIKDMYHAATIDERKGTDVLDDLGIDWRGVTRNKFPLSPDQFYQISFPYNSDKPTKVWGFEVEHQANFRFLPGLLKNILLSYNFSLIRSETNIISSKIENYQDTTIILGRPVIQTRSRTVMINKNQKLEDQPEFFGNVSLGYDLEGFSFRISLFYQGEYNTSFSRDQRGDGVQGSYTKVDIALKQRITDNFSVFLNLNNITDTEEIRYIQNRITDRQLYDYGTKYGMSVDLGVRAEL